MRDNERNELRIDGRGVDVDAHWASKETAQGFLWLLNQNVGKHPWIVGIAAIVAIVMFAADVQHQSIPLVGIFAVVVVTTIATMRTKIEREEPHQPSRE